MIPRRTTIESLSRRKPRDLEFNIVLVRPEPGLRIVRQIATHQYLHNGLRLLNRIPYTFQPDAFFAKRKGRASPVAKMSGSKVRQKASTQMPLSIR